MIGEISIAFSILISKPFTQYTLFGNNNRTLKLTKVLKIRPRMKYIAIKYYYFWVYIANSNIIIKLINTNLQ